MQNIFFILGKELTFSDERVNYVKLKREYDKKIPEAKKCYRKNFQLRKKGMLAH